MSLVALNVLVDRLPPGSAVYLDRDWIGGAEPVDVFSAIVLDGDLGFRWPGGSGPPLDSGDPHRVAWRMIDALAESVAEVAGHHGPACVLGHGLLAARLKARIGEEPTKPPEVLIETTGSSVGIAKACSAAADLGTVILAVTPLEGAVPYDLYTDVHRRGLSIVGVPDPDLSVGPERAAEYSPPAEIGTTRSMDLTSEWFVARA